MTLSALAVQIGFIKFVAQPLWTVWNKFVSPSRDTEQQTNVKTNLYVCLCG
jgi:hypothetical protein